MPYRTVPLIINQFYHVINRGVASLPIFSTTRDYLRFLDLIDYYRFANTPMSFSNLMKLPREQRNNVWATLRDKNFLHAEVLTFCLMPNHFHFLLKQTAERGISTFLGNLENSYAKYFNAKSTRAGPLFQSMFKAVRIETNEQLLHVSRYIHLNPSTGYLVEIKDLARYRWSSLPNYLDESESITKYSFVNIDVILSFFKDKKDYKNFVFDQAEYQRELDRIKHLILE